MASVQLGLRSSLCVMITGKGKTVTAWAWIGKCRARCCTSVGTAQRDGTVGSRRRKDSVSG